MIRWWIVGAQFVATSVIIWAMWFFFQHFKP